MNGSEAARLFAFESIVGCRLSSDLGGCFLVVLEASNVDEATDGVAGQVPKSQGDAAQVLQASVYGFGGVVGRGSAKSVGEGV